MHEIGHGWQELYTHLVLKARRKCAIAMMGDKYLVVYGGISPSNVYLNDITFLNIGLRFFNFLM